MRSGDGHRQERLHQRGGAVLLGAQTGGHPSSNTASNEVACLAELPRGLKFRKGQSFAVLTRQAFGERYRADLVDTAYALSVEWLNTGHPAPTKEP